MKRMCNTIQHVRAALRTRLRNKKGSSLVEVIVSAVIILLVTGMFYAGHQFAVRYLQMAREEQQNTDTLLELYHTSTARTEISGELTITIIAGEGNGDMIDARYELSGGSEKKTYCVEYQGKRLYYWEIEAVSAP